MNNRTPDIEQLFKKKYKELCLLSYHYVQDVQEAEDIVQDVFINLLHKDSLTNIKNIEAYLSIAIKNNSIRAFKRKQNFDSINTTLKEVDLLTTEEDLNEEQLKMLRLTQHFYTVLNELPPQCRHVFLLAGLNGMKYKEAAEELGISTNTVKTQMKKAYKLMRKSLQQLYFFFLSYTTSSTHKD